jgi:hypothetical protein
MTSLTQVGAVFAKIEDTPGVENVPTTTGSPNDFIQALNAQYAPEFNIIDRNFLRPSLSQVPHLMGRQLATLTFTTEVFGTGTAATDTDTTAQSAATPKWADLFEGCAMAGTAVSTPAGKIYNPITASQKTMTLYCYYDGKLHKLIGAMGTFQLSATAGEIATIQWTFTGVYVAPTAAATPTPGFTNVTPPLVESCSLVVGSTLASVFVSESIGIDIGNTVTPRADANSAKGFNSMIITGRAASFTFTPEAVPEASHPFWADFASAAIKSVSFNIGTTAGNQMQVNMPNMQISGLTYADRNGIRVYDVTGRPSATETAGNDELTLKFV